MGKKQKKPGKGKEKTDKKTAKADEKKSRRESKKLSPEDDIDAILLSIQKEEAKKKEVHVEDNVPRPTPRSNCSLNVNPLKETELVLYGGEFYNGNKTYVYGDLYRYDIEKQEWKSISSPNSPPPRSAHQAVAWKNYIYIYGGEFTSPNQERFHHYKDFWMLDLKTNQWEQLNYKGCPSPRSGHRMVLYKHKIVVFGGFYDTLREVRYYSDLHVFDLDTFKWQEIKPGPGCLWPSARSGFQFFVYQDEVSDVLMSLFLNELYGFQLDNHRWYPLELRKEKSTKDKLKRNTGQTNSEQPLENTVSSTDPETIEVGEGNEALEDQQVADLEDNVSELYLDTVMKVRDNGGGKCAEPSTSNNLQSLAELEIVKPCGRINSCMVVGRDTLYLYGGMMEIKDREITLDDLYMLNLSKLDEWKCLIPTSESEWVEASEEEDDDEDEDEDENDSEEGSASGSDDADDEDDDDETEASKVGNAVALIRGEGKTLRRKEKRARIEQIRASLGLSDSARTPMPGETLRDFYKRTNMYWQMAAHEHTQHTGKELRKDGFDLAESRYRELKPILDELAILEAEQKAEEQQVAESSSRKAGHKKNNIRHSTR